MQNSSKRAAPVYIPPLIHQMLALVIRAFAIVIGIGAMPWLSQGESEAQAGNLFWIVGLVVGLITVGVGIYLALPPRTPTNTAAKRPGGQAASAALQRSKALTAQVGARLRTAAATLTQQLARLRPLLQRFTASLRRKPKPAIPSSGAAPIGTVAPVALTAQVSSPAAQTAPPAPVAPPAMGQPTAGQSVVGQPSSGRPSVTAVQAIPPIDWYATLQAWLVLLTPTVTIGVFVILGALVAMILHRNEIARAGALAVYFSLPGILLWVIVEGVQLYTNLIIKPKRLAQLAAIAASATQICGGLFLWIYLGLAVTLERLGGLFTLAVGLVLVGVLLGVIALLAQQQMRQQVAATLASP